MQHSMDWTASCWSRCYFWPKTVQNWLSKAQHLLLRRAGQSRYWLGVFSDILNPLITPEVSRWRSPRIPVQLGHNMFIKRKKDLLRQPHYSNLNVCTVCVGMFVCVVDFLFTGFDCGWCYWGKQSKRKAKEWRNVGQVNQTEFIYCLQSEGALVWRTSVLFGHGEEVNILYVALIESHKRQSCFIWSKC